MMKFNMKKILTIISLFFLFVSCDQNNSSNSSGHSITKWQDPTCGNKTLPEIIEGTFFETKWSAYQNKNDMNGKYVQLTGVNKKNREISVVFKYNYDRWDVMQKNQLDLDNLDFSFAWIDHCK